MKMNVDDRRSFTELVHTTDCSQVSINISKPGITKGQHWHNSKWEKFIVVHGHGLIQERNINTGETVEFEVSGDKIEAIYIEDRVLLYHGSKSGLVGNIAPISRAQCDFGQGFYMGTDPIDSYVWAKIY